MIAKQKKAAIKTILIMKIDEHIFLSCNCKLISMVSFIFKAHRCQYSLAEQGFACLFKWAKIIQNKDTKILVPKNKGDLY
jgi:hypothetical protein